MVRSSALRGIDNAGNDEADSAAGENARAHNQGTVVRHAEPHVARFALTQAEHQLTVHVAKHVRDKVQLAVSMAGPRISFCAFKTDGTLQRVFKAEGGMDNARLHQWEWSGCTGDICNDEMVSLAWGKGYQADSDNVGAIAILT